MKILLAIDGSAGSEAAVEEAARMPWRAGSQVKVLSVAFVPLSNAPDPLGVVDPVRQTLIDREQARLGGVVARAADCLRNNSEAVDLNIETAVVEGTPQSAIIEEAEKWGADLIMVGCHGYGRIKRFLLGSVALALAVHAPCSVEIVRRGH